MNRDSIRAIDTWLREINFSSFVDLLIGFALISMVLAVVLALCCLRAYSLRMKRLIKLTEVAPPPTLIREKRAKRVVESRAGKFEEAMDLSTVMKQRDRRIAIATWGNYLILVVGGSVLFWLVKDKAAFSWYVVSGYLAAMMLGPALVNVRPDGNKRVLLCTPLLVVLLSFIDDPNQSLGASICGATLMFIIYLSGVHRTMRAVMVPLITICVGISFGILAAIFVSYAVAKYFDAVLVDELAIRLVSSASMCFGMLLFGYWIPLLLLEWLLSVIRRGWLSDISVVSGAGLLLAFAFLFVLMDLPGLPRWLIFISGMALLLVALSFYILSLRIKPCPLKSRTLLVLRVFSTDRKTEHLLDKLQTRWRLAGPVVEIGGPDLALINLDLGEFVKFLGFKLQDLIHPSGLPNERFLDYLDLEMDREGRFRLNEVFCFDSSWREMVDRLMKLADVVLLDLRGFNEKRGGTMHEVSRLGELGLLSRVVALYDRETVWSDFDAALAGRQNLVTRVDTHARYAFQCCLRNLLRIADTQSEQSISVIASCRNDDSSLGSQLEISSNTLSTSSRSPLATGKPGIVGWRRTLIKGK